jgi:protein-tyrosine phosphatase
VIDLHSHLLPAVDDGARTVEQAVGTLREMARHGVSDLCLTPHLTATEAEHGVPPRHDAAFEALRAAAPSAPRLHRGAEVMLDRPLSAEAASIPGIRLGGTRYILVEFPRLVSGGTVSNALAHVISLGLVPVLAHPERYTCCSPNAVHRWRSMGALMQVDATTLLSRQGRGDRARQLVAAGLADLLAADNHGDSRMLLAGRRMLEDSGGAVQADLLTRQNPAAILADRPTLLAEPLELKASLLDRLRRLLNA